MKKLLLIIALFSIAKINAQNITCANNKDYEDGNTKFKGKSYALAIQAYDKAIALVDADAKKSNLNYDIKKCMVDVYTRRATCYYYTGNYTAMKADADKILSVDTANADVRALLGYPKYKAGNKKEACATIRTQIIKGSEIGKKVFEDCFCWTEGMILYKDGLTQSNLKRYDAALVKLNEALTILPDSGAIYAERAKVYLETNQPEKAMADIDMAIAKKTRNYKVYYLRAQANIKVDKLDSAFEDLNTCLNLKKDYYDAYLLRAEVAEKQEKWNNAVFDYNLLIKMRPDFGMNYYKLALVKHNGLNDLLGACDMYTAAANRGVEEAKEMATNCATPKYMRKNLVKAPK
ncbi:MAG TPA: tetratricopeptide repeat protein [Bacteroidia bacterium]|nr:tetratricopeptide repeat protein [Bacteroidia bacterium]